MSYPGQSGELPLVVWVWRSGKLINVATTQAQIQSFELIHANIYLIYEVLECVKGLPGSADPNLQDPHDTGQQVAIQEESR